VERTAFVAAGAILTEVERILEPDPPTFDVVGIAGSGEPTLNLDIGRVIDGVKSMTDVPVAVLTNGSLLWMPEVQDALMSADIILPSLDAGDAGAFAYVNRPHPDIGFEQMVEGIASFTSRYPGEVWLEVLLLAGVTGIPTEAARIAALAERIGPARVQLNTVCRPPAEQSALAVPPGEMEALRALFSGEVEIVSHLHPELTTGPEPCETGGADVLALLRRRPCTVEDVAEGLGLHINETLKQLSALVQAGEVTTAVVSGRTFYAAVDSWADPQA
jgi:wyosine [tRNA(Phe)-imidazoG37] synthetase (radical SAM superfamily)